jgi:hypothetical protein
MDATISLFIAFMVGGTLGAIAMALVNFNNSRDPEIGTKDTERWDFVSEYGVGVTLTGAHWACVLNHRVIGDMSPDIRVAVDSAKAEMEASGHGR